MLTWLFTTECRHQLQPYSTSSSIVDQVNKEMAQFLNKVVIHQYGTRSTLTHILRLAQKIKNQGEDYNIETYEHILSAYAKAKETNKIQVLLKQMDTQNIPISKEFAVKALKAAAHSGDSVLQAYIISSMEANGIPKTTKIYSHLIACMRENLEFERALDTLDLMKKQNIPASLHIYQNLIDLAVNVHESDIATQLLKEIEHLNSHAASEERPFLKVLRCAALYGKYDLIKFNWRYAVIDNHCKPDEGICLYVLHSAGHNGDAALATEVINYLGQEGYTYKEYHFRSLIEAFSSAGNFSGAFQVFSFMREKGIVPTQKTALSIAQHLGNDKNVIHAARDILADIASTPNGQVDISLYNLIIHALAFNGENEDAIQMYKQSDKYKVHPNSETLDAVLDAYIHCKDAEHGVSAFEEFSQMSHVTERTLSKMVTLMCTQENYEDAFKYLERMKELNMIPQRGCYYKLIKRLSAAGDPRLEMALEDMKAYEYPLSTFLADYIDRGQRIKEYNRIKAQEEGY